MISTTLRQGGSYLIFAFFVALGPTAMLIPAVGHAQALAAAVLPTSRSGRDTDTITAFSTILVVGGLATQCSIAPVTEVTADFFYQTTDPFTNQLLGTPNTPVDITNSQSFVIGFTPTAPFGPTEITFAFDCTNTAPAPTVAGVNTLLLSASDVPVPDIIAIAATPGGRGITKPGSDGTASAFGGAAINIGLEDDIDMFVDSNNVILPVTFTLCETDLAGLCINPTTPTAPPVTMRLSNLETATFSVFVTATGTIPLDPANSRAFVRFRDQGGVDRGSTSVAIETRELPDVTGDYVGLVDETLSNCSDPADNGDIQAPTTLTIDTQDGANFSGTTFSEVNFSGVLLTQTGTIMGTVDVDGNVTADLTSDFFINGEFDSSAVGTAVGTLVGDFLAVEIAGMDVVGDMCNFVGTFEGSR